MKSVAIKIERTLLKWPISFWTSSLEHLNWRSNILLWFFVKAFLQHAGLFYCKIFVHEQRMQNSCILFQESSNEWTSTMSFLRCKTFSNKRGNCFNSIDSYYKYVCWNYLPDIAFNFLLTDESCPKCQPLEGHSIQQYNKLCYNRLDARPISGCSWQILGEAWKKMSSHEWNLSNFKMHFVIRNIQ